MNLRLGPFRVDRSARVLYRDGQVVPLTPKAFDTLLIHAAVVAAMGHMWGEAGQPAKARDALVRLGRLAPDKGMAAYLRASILAALGETGPALDALEESLAARDSHLVWSAIDPDFGRLRGNPRFARILTAVGLPVT